MAEIGTIVESLGYSFAARISERTKEQLIRSYGRGADLMAYEATGKTGPVSLGGSTPRHVTAVIDDMVKPIQDWHENLASQVGDMVRQKFVDEKMTPGQLAKYIRTELPKQIGDEKFTIQREGKRPYTTTPKAYSEMLARTLPNRLRNEAYLEHAETMGIYDGWISFATGDERMCHLCGKRHGKLFPFGADTPPYHPWCLLPGTRCIAPGGIVAGLRSWYEGPVIELSFADGCKITVTPNHMLLTPHGFAAAKLLRKGDDVIHCPSFKGPTSGYPDNDRDIPTIEEIFNSLLVAPGVPVRSVPLSPEDLHGDAVFIKKNVDVVRPRGFLRAAFEPPGFEHLLKDDLNPGNTRLVRFSGEGHLTSLFKALSLAADGSMGRLRKSHPFFLWRAAHPEIHRLAAVSRRNPAALQASPDGVPGAPETLSQCLDRHASFVKPDNLIDIKVYNYHGYVYDLESVSTLLIGNGVIVSNCRCRPIAHLREDSETPEGAPVPAEILFVRTKWEEVDKLYADVLTLEDERKKMVRAAEGQPLTGADARALKKLEDKMTRLRSRAAKSQVELYRVKAKFYGKMSQADVETLLNQATGRGTAYLAGIGPDAARDVGAVVNAYAKDYPAFFRSNVGAVVTRADALDGDALARFVAPQIEEELIRKGAGAEWAAYQAKKQARERATALIQELNVPIDTPSWYAKSVGTDGLQTVMINDALIKDPKLWKSKLLSDVQTGARSWGSENPLSVVEGEFGRAAARGLDMTGEGAELRQLFDKLDKTTITRDLSRTAARSAEDFASEAWVEFRLSPSPRPMAMAVGRHMEESLQVYERAHRGDTIDTCVGSKFLDPATPLTGEIPPAGPSQAEISKKVAALKKAQKAAETAQAAVLAANQLLKEVQVRGPKDRQEVFDVEDSFKTAKKAETNLATAHQTITDLQTWFMTNDVQNPLPEWKESPEWLDKLPDLMEAGRKKALTLMPEINKELKDITNHIEVVETFNDTIKQKIENGADLNNAIGERRRAALSLMVATTRAKDLETKIQSVTQWTGKDIQIEPDPSKIEIKWSESQLADLVKTAEKKRATKEAESEPKGPGEAPAGVPAAIEKALLDARKDFRAGVKKVKAWNKKYAKVATAGATKGEALKLQIEYDKVHLIYYNLDKTAETIRDYETVYETAGLKTPGRKVNVSDWPTPEKVDVDALVEKRVGDMRSEYEAARQKLVALMKVVDDFNAGVEADIKGGAPLQDLLRAHSDAATSLEEAKEVFKTVQDLQRGIENATQESLEGHNTPDPTKVRLVVSEDGIRKKVEVRDKAVKADSPTEPDPDLLRAMEAAIEEENEYLRSVEWYNGWIDGAIQDPANPEAALIQRTSAAWDDWKTASEAEEKAIKLADQIKAAGGPDLSKDIPKVVEKRPKYNTDNIESVARGKRTGDIAEDWGGWYDDLSAEELETLKNYSMTGYQSINDSLREGKTPDYRVTTIDAALERGRLKEQTVYRGVKLDPETRAVFERSIGTVISDPAFVSTSRDKHQAESFLGVIGTERNVLMEIKVPNGAKGAYMAPISEIRSEEEVLLPRNTLLRVTDVTTDEHGVMKVKADLVSEPEKPKFSDKAILKRLNSKIKEVRDNLESSDSLVEALDKLFDDPKATEGKLKGVARLSWEDWEEAKKSRAEALKIADEIIDAGGPDKRNTVPTVEDHKPKYTESEVEKVNIDRKTSDAAVGWSEWNDGLTKKERETLVRYSDEYYTDINNHLRTGEKAKRGVAGNIKRLDSAIKKSELKEQTVYRGVRLSPELQEVFTRSVGTVISDPAFVSTTRDGKQAEAFAGTGQWGGGKKPAAVMEIRVPKGARGAYIAPMSANSYEEEVLLPRGSKFTIQSVTSSKGILRVVADLVI